MTDTLKKAIEQLQQMPEERQDSLARLVLHKIDQDRLWAQSTDAHAEKLGGLVDDILAADDRGECEPLIPNEM
ncbi:MAG: hypothetical protein GXP24_03985 [Planctomycetes bacterium]|nr:hypothetical protein [Planctomycetota bacterium]